MYVLEAKTGEGKNKLRTYALFKREWGFGQYLNIVDDRGKECSFLNLEWAYFRYESKQGGTRSLVLLSRDTIGLFPEDRKCLCCSLDKVEDEYHFLLQCTAFEARRQRLLGVVQKYFKLSDDTMYTACIGRDDVFVCIMECTDVHVLDELAKYRWDAFIIRERILM